MEQSALRDLFYRRVGNTALAVSNHLELHLPLFRFQNRAHDNVLRMWLYICTRLLTSVYTRYFHTYIYIRPVEKLNLIMSIALGMCETPGCNAVASLQCPTCLKIGIQGSYFCSQVRRVTPLHVNHFIRLNQLFRFLNLIFFRHEFVECIKCQSILIKMRIFLKRVFSDSQNLYQSRDSPIKSHH